MCNIRLTSIVLNKQIMYVLLFIEMSNYNTNYFPKTNRMNILEHAMNETDM